MNTLKLKDTFFHEIMVESKLGIHLDTSSCSKIEKELMIVKAPWSVTFPLKAPLIAPRRNTHCYKAGRKLFKIWCF